MLVNCAEMSINAANLPVEAAKVPEKATVAFINSVQITGSLVTRTASSDEHAL